jgi:hypothetical protein
MSWYPRDINKIKDRTQTTSMDGILEKQRLRKRIGETGDGR